MATIDELMTLNTDIDEKDINEAIDGFINEADMNDIIDSKINNPLSMYMYEMSRWKPFTEEEEKQIFKETCCCIFSSCYGIFHGCMRKC